MSDNMILIAVRDTEKYIPIGSCEKITITERKTENNNHSNISLITYNTNIIKPEDICDKGILSVQTQAYPVDIIIYDNKNKNIKTIIKNAWINNILDNQISWDAEFINSQKEGELSAKV